MAEVIGPAVFPVEEAVDSPVIGLHPTVQGHQGEVRDHRIRAAMEAALEVAVTATIITAAMEVALATGFRQERLPAFHHRRHGRMFHRHRRRAFRHRRRAFRHRHHMFRHRRRVFRHRRRLLSSHQVDHIPTQGEIDPITMLAAITAAIETAVITVAAIVAMALMTEAVKVTEKTHILR